MDFVNLNRLGILLNFAAGLMLAPELLGEERLHKSEAHLEKALLKLQEFLKQILVHVRTMWLVMIASIVNILIWFLVMRYYAPFIVNFTKGTFFEWKSSVTAWRYFFTALALICIGICGQFLWTDWPPTFIKYKRLRFINFYLELAVIMLSVVFVPVVSLITYPLLRLSEYTASRLAGEDRLRSLLVWWGVAFFIVGNALQLYATFEPRPIPLTTSTTRAGVHSQLLLYHPALACPYALYQPKFLALDHKCRGYEALEAVTPLNHPLVAVLPTFVYISQSLA